MVIRLYLCTGWSAPLLVTYAWHIFAWPGSKTEMIQICYANRMTSRLRLLLLQACFAQTCLFENWAHYSVSLLGNRKTSFYFFFFCHIGSIEFDVSNICCHESKCCLTLIE